jgi:hypothetical protein
MNYPEDEISLYELWNVIVKRKILFYLVFVVIFITGILIALLSPKHYQYTQGIKIASYYDDGKTVTLQNPKAIASKITALYLPTILNQYNIKDADISTNDLGDSVVVLSAKGLLQNKAAYSEIFKAILARLGKEEKHSLQAIKNSFTNQLARLNKESESQINFNQTLAKKRKINLQDLALQHVILNQKQENYADLAANIAQVQRNLNTLHTSHFISTMIRSAEPVRISKLALVVLFIIAAFILALFAVFIAEFFAKARQLGKD